MKLTQLVNVRVVDFSSEKNLGRNHWVLVWQEKLSIEETALVRSLSRASNLHKEVAGVTLTGLSINSDN